MKNKIYYLTLILIIHCFFFCDSGQTASISIAGEPLIIPSKYGTVKEVFNGDSIRKNSRKIIIHIQDAHSNYEAQKNIAHLLECLIKEHNLKLVMVEGGSGDVSLSYLRDYADKNNRKEIAENYLKSGEISGEEYLDIISDYNFDLYGIEDEKLYDKHLSSFMKIDPLRGEGLKYIEKITPVIESLKTYIYNDPLKQLEAKKKDYEHNTISLLAYCRAIKKMAAAEPPNVFLTYIKRYVLRKKVDIQNYPNLTAFLEAAGLEKNIDFKQAERERNNLIKDLANLLDKNGVEELIRQSQYFKLGITSGKRYYSFLKSLVPQKVNLERDYPDLNSYIEYITVNTKVDAQALLKEVNLIEEDIKEFLFTNDTQRTLNKISKSSNFLTRLLNLEITPEDYKYFQANRSDFLTSGWAGFLSACSKKYNLTPPPPSSAIIDGNFDKFVEFYKLGIIREKAFVENLDKKMDESGENIGVLITGGFHTPGITRALKDKDYFYVVVTPKITQNSDSRTYFSALRSAGKIGDVNK